MKKVSLLILLAAIITVNSKQITVENHANMGNILVLGSNDPQFLNYKFGTGGNFQDLYNYHISTLDTDQGTDTKNPFQKLTELKNNEKQTINTKFNYIFFVDPSHYYALDSAIVNAGRTYDIININNIFKLNIT